MKKLSIITWLFLLVILSSCTTPTTTTNTEDRDTSSTTPSVTIVNQNPAPEPIESFTSDENTKQIAISRVMARVTSLAVTPEAKEFMSIYTKHMSTCCQYDENSSVWSIGWGSGMVYDSLKAADWFQCPDIDYVEDILGGEPKPTWLVFSDGTIVPIDRGLVVESYIAQLNIDRVLK